MPGRESRDITKLLQAWRGGEQEALGDLMPLVYQRLKKIAGHLVSRERQNHTLEATALVHETYVRLINLERVSWKDRAHFYALCARMMRRLLVDHARAYRSEKRGGNAWRIETAELRNLASERAPDLVALDEALTELTKRDAERAKIVELRFFGGLDREQIAEVLGLSSATVTRRWRSARAWLTAYLEAA